MYKQKYLKYKNKYISLKQNGGGTLRIINSSKPNEILENVSDTLIEQIPRTQQSIINPYSITQNNDKYRISKDGHDYGADYTFELTHEPKESSISVEHLGATHMHQPHRINIIGSYYNNKDPENTDFTKMIINPKYKNTFPFAGEFNPN